MNDWRAGRWAKCVVSYDGWDLGRAHLRGQTLPVLGGVYCIRSVEPYRDRLGIHLEEIVNPVLEWEDGLKELLFSTRNFRLLPDTSREVALIMSTNLRIAGVRTREFT